MAKILVIDDSKLSRGMVTRPLTSAGHAVVEAADGQEGLDAYQQHQPDCIVVDLLMRVMDGDELLRRLRSGGSDVPVIIATANIQQASRSACEALGISGFLNKPIKASQLIACVNQALAEEKEEATA